MKEWTGENCRFFDVPYPDGFRQNNISLEVFEQTLSEKAVDPDRVFGVMSETCGKGISGGMPLSMIVGAEKLMNLYGLGEMTSTRRRAGEPDPDMARGTGQSNRTARDLLYALVAGGGYAVKINPPLTINQETLRKGLGLL